ncbi:MAG: lycopene cyclase family protein [Chitinophagaceae bacterium]
MASSQEKVYDYIITGTGCAGLSLIVHLIKSGQFKDKKILLVDKETKNKNDRTWCFWEKEPGLFEELVFREWKQAWFHTDDLSRLLKLSPYTYKLIKGIDFYNYCFKLIKQQTNIDVLKGEVQQMASNEKETFVVVGSQKIYAEYIFNSILFEKPVLQKNEFYLLQHFKGWIIKTPKPVFKPDEATLMDFRISQRHGTSFVYVMPFLPTMALVEYTLFTGKLLDQRQYDDGLRNYIQRFIFKGPYKVDEEEFGVIPMTNHQFESRDNNIIHIGTAGGQTKASSGYTFKFIQKHSAAITDQLVRTGKPFIRATTKKRFHFYDSVLLNILHHKEHPGKDIFEDLFKKNKPQHVLRFLDNESSLKSELKIISSLPTWPFFKAALKQL